MMKSLIFISDLQPACTAAVKFSKLDADAGFHFIKERRPDKTPPRTSDWLYSSQKSCRRSHGVTPDL